MLIIGESLNATRKEVREAVISHDREKVQLLAKAQEAAGADMLDVNAAVAGQDEVEDLKWMVKAVQEVVGLPLVLDSSDIEALIAAMEIHRGRPMINSISAENEKMTKLLPIVAKADCSVIVLCMDDQGIPTTVEGRMKAAKTAIYPLLEAGKKKEDIYVDPLVMSVSIDPNAAKTTLKVIEELSTGELAGVQITGGVSNVSYGMPGRKLINRIFLATAMAKGLNSCVVDVRDQAMMSTIYAGMSLLEERGASKYLKAYRKGKLLI